MYIQKRCKYLLLAMFFPILLFCGCSEKVWVEDVQVQNQPTGTITSAELQNVPADTLDYFSKLYPPGKFIPANKGHRQVAVGPILIGTKAMIVLDDSEDKAITTVKQGEHSDILIRGPKVQSFLISSKSYEAQAIVVQTLVHDTRFDISALDEVTSVALYKGEKRYLDLRARGIYYYIAGNLVVEEEHSQKFRVYLRLVDTATQKILSATSASGKTLNTMVSEAASKLLNNVNGK